MTLAITFAVLSALFVVTLGLPVKESGSASEHTETDSKIIRQKLEDLIDQLSLQFIEYGPDGDVGYKYHLAVENKEFIIRTTGPVFIPIAQSFRGTREEKDKKLLQLLIESAKIKSMENLKNNTL
ncbi:uncharacterized protein LOC131431966 [Malaya genurostris]|uniref:uncharacterized protein LOC131431966 n=1 Tax=Malaya genurostris TaxID=325434 RepID=UPI0026F3C393|nr:uncharacterized protein LOC131431966 [Malaya genurostris]